MANIDDKVVAMSFDGGKFESGVRTTLSALDKLKQALSFKDSSKGLNDISNASKRVDFSHMASGIEDVKNRLNAFRLVAIAVFAQVAQRAISTGLQFAKSFTIQPIMAGFKEYTTNLNAIQTILANTQASGATLKDVNASLLELNKYSDKTIYNFAEMARNIGTFTAAGVDLQTSTAAIKGIANLAALSGSNAQQASTAMYQLSQAIASGRVSLMDWNSVVNAGMGGTVFQRALAQTAEAMGTLKKGAVALEGPMKNVKINGESFRQSMQAGPGKQSWLTSDVLTKTLKQFTGDMSAAQLKAEGFSDAQIKAIRIQAKTAMEAATKVKTLSQVLDVAKETAQSGWAQTWQLVFGDFGEARTTFTNLSNAINGFINKSAQARNSVLKDWKDLGGRTNTIWAIKTAFENLGQILAPIKEAFRDIFPAKTGRDLANLTTKFMEFAVALKPSPETVENLHRTFRGLFAILDIGRQIVSGIFTVFKTLFTAVGGGNGSFLKFTASIGDFLVKLDLALKKGTAFHDFFVGIGTVLAVPVRLLLALGQAIANLFSGFSPGGFSGKMDSVTASTKPFKKAIDGISEALQGLGPAISNAISNINWDTILAVVRTGLFAALVLMIRKFIGGTNLKQIFGIMGKNVGKSFGAGILGNIGKAFGGLTGTMKAMQTELKARTLQEIAIAIALLAASVLALSLVKPERMNAALGAMTIMFGELLAAMKIMDKITSGPAFVKLPVIAASLILLAGAIDLLTISVIAMSKLSWEQLSKGLAGVAGLLGGLSVASTVLSKNAAGMIRSSIGIMGIAVAMKILASAMKDFGNMDWTQLAKGLVGVGGGLTAIAVSMQMMPKNMVLRSAAIIAIAAALNIIAEAMAKFGAMNWSQIGKGLIGVGGSLVAIATAMHLMPKSMVLTAAGLLLVAASLGKIADAVGEMGGMSISQIAKGLGTLAGSLVILAAALHAMSGTLGGAVALAAAGAGIALLAPALATLGKQSWTEIVKSMVTLAAALAVLGIAGVALGPVVPALLGLGAALVLIGGGLALAGAGIFLISSGISALAVAGPAGIAVLISAIKQFLEAVPKMAEDFALALLSIVEALAKTAPQFVAAMVKIIESLLEAIIQSAPKIGAAFEALLIAALGVLARNQDKIIQAGFNLILALLKGIKNNIGALVTQTVDIIVNFLNAIAANLGRIVAAGAQILVSLLKGIANGVTAVITAGTEIIVNFITGIGKGASKVVTAGTDAVISFIKGVGSNAIRLARAAAQTILDFINGLTQAINDYAPQLQIASLKLGYAIINGMTLGLAGKAGEVINKAKDIGNSVKDALGSAWGVFHSPPDGAIKMGKNIIMGLAMGLNNSKPAIDIAYSIGNRLISAFNDVFQTASPSKVMYEIGKYVGQGFAQGLRGSSEDINNAFIDLNGKLTEAMRTARETIATEQEKLDKLRAEKKPDMDAIKAAQETIAENESILERSKASLKVLTQDLKDEKKELIGLSNQFNTVTATLDAAKQKLAELKQEKAEFSKGLVDQYSTLPSITMTDAEGNPVDPVAMYTEALKNQTDAAAAYNATLQQLRKLGLDDATYQKLLTEGPADQAFAKQLLAGGKTAVEGLNKLDANLTVTSKRLATNAANNLKQAGIDAAEGLVKGLQSKHDAIRREMEEIAREMLAALKKELKIKSPSQVFAEIGGYAMEGFALGFSNSMGSMRWAAEHAANTAMEAIKRSMRNISSAVKGQIDINPVITPVLDLSLVKAASGELSKLTNVQSYAQASAISVQRISAEEAAATQGTSIKFEQNNYSPEALSEVEIYRQTKNQLSQLRAAFAL